MTPRVKKAVDELRTAIVDGLYHGQRVRVSINVFLEDRVNYELLEFVTKVIEKACDDYQLPQAFVLSETRKKEAVNLRMHIAHALYYNQRIDQSTLGKALKRDRSTVAVMISKIKGYIDTKSDFDIQMYQTIFQIIQQVKQDESN